MTRVPLFVELCAGTAAVSLRLRHKHGRPPFGRPGSKLGYADALLDIMGLWPGLGADAYLWCEPDPPCALMLEAYACPGLMREAAAEARRWAGEEPRALWMRLRAEGSVRGVTAREVARWAFLMRGSYMGRGPDQGIGNPEGRVGDGSKGCRNSTTPMPLTLTLPARLEEVPLCVASVGRDARTEKPSTVPTGTVAYIDPSYRGTKPFRHNLSRAEVVELAQWWADAGAAVYVSEAVPVEELLVGGWRAVEVTGLYRGSVRSFSRQQREWLTMNREPARRFAVQSPLFGNAT